MENEPFDDRVSAEVGVPPIAARLTAQLGDGEVGLDRALGMIVESIAALEAEIATLRIRD